MNLFFAPMLIGTLVLAGALPSAAQPKPASDQGTSVGMSATHDTAAAERGNYTLQAQNAVRVWQQRLHDFDAKVRVKATGAEASASKDLDSAWAETKTAFGRLETAGANDWDSAKTSFRVASDKLAMTWQKLNPADK